MSQRRTCNCGLCKTCRERDAKQRWRETKRAEYDPGAEMTLTEIAAELGITKQRAQQLLASAMRKLHASALEDFT